MLGSVNKIRYPILGHDVNYERNEVNTVERAPLEEVQHRNRKPYRVGKNL